MDKEAIMRKEKIKAFKLVFLVFYGKGFAFFHHQSEVGEVEKDQFVIVHKDYECEILSADVLYQTS